MIEPLGLRRSFPARQIFVFGADRSAQGDNDDRERSDVVRKATMIRTMLALLVLCVPALARDYGQYNNASAEVRQSFRSQKSPKTRGLCCNDADATYAE